METKSVDKLAAKLVAAHYAYRIFVWTTAILGLAYLIWLGWSRDLFEPVPIEGAEVNLDLLQSLAFLIAVTALEGTAVVAAFNKFFALLMPSDYEGILRVQRALG